MLFYLADSKIFLIGPGRGSNGKSEVLSLPDLVPLDCNIPVFPEGGQYNAYVGRSTSDGVHMCGGRTSNNYYNFMSSCYLLSASGYKEMPGPMKKRYNAASVVTPLGWWMTGIQAVSMYLVALLSTICSRWI